MSAGTSSLTLEQFHEQYAVENGWEYWFGEAVRKGMGTIPHGVLQALLCDLFRQCGYQSGTEIDLRIDPDWEPRPDVIAAVQLSGRYPTRPVDIVAEVLSPDDGMAGVFKKCRQYARIGIPQIFVFDPEARDAWEWSRETDNLERALKLILRNGSVIAVADIWAELDRRLSA
jgi:Uma2 family endonuclease